MLFAKLTLCSHGNESCRDRERERERERWIAGLVYNHTIIRPSVTARYAVRELERKSLHNGSHLLDKLHTQTHFYRKHYSALERHNDRLNKRGISSVILMFGLKQTQWVIWKEFSLESLTWKHFIPPLSLIHCNHTTAFSSSHFTDCLYFPVPILCPSPFRLTKFISGEQRQWQRLKH